jgi:hypothetical protein
MRHTKVTIAESPQATQNQMLHRVPVAADCMATVCHECITEWSCAKAAFAQSVTTFA